MKIRNWKLKITEKGFTPLEISNPDGNIPRYMMKRGQRKSLTGFTIPELLVSLFVFSLAILGAGGLLVSGINVQRRSEVQQELMDQASYLAEYMSRDLRQARKELGSPPLCLTARGFNYEITEGGKGIQFLNKGNQCQEFRLAGTRIEEVFWLGGVVTSRAFLTSDNVQVAGLTFVISGQDQGDNLQPKATFAIELKGKVLQAGFQPVTRIQTTVSQRKIDVPE